MTRNHHAFTVKKKYPPDKHLLRDLGLSLTFEGSDRATIQAPAAPEVCSETGSVHAGVLATLIDVLGGFLCMEAFSPDWMATAHLSLHACGPAPLGTVSASGRLLRSGRTTATVRTEIYAGSRGAEPPPGLAGVAMTTYSRMEGVRAGTWADDRRTQPVEFGRSRGDAGLRQHLIQQCGIKQASERPGGLLLEMSDYVSNSFGSLQGGMIALLADVAGASAARAAGDRRLTTSDLVLHYLSPGRFGPFITQAQVMRADKAAVLSRIEIMDTGEKDRVIAVAMNNCR